MLLQGFIFYYLIVCVLNCQITFQNSNDGNCSTEPDEMKCTILNPNLNIQKEICRSDLKTIIFIINDIDIFDEFLQKNHKAMKSFYELFGNTLQPSVQVSLINAASKSENIELMIDEQWISRIIDKQGLRINDLRLVIRVVDHNWTKINLTINPNIRLKVINLPSIRFIFVDKGHPSRPGCMPLIYPEQHLKDRLSGCARFITFINDSK